MISDWLYTIVLIVALVIEFPLVLIIYLILSIMYVISVILKFIFKPFKILFEKLFY